MMTNPIGGLTASNAAYNWMSAANSLLALSSCNTGNTASLFAAEKRLRLNMLNDEVAYQAGLLMQESQDKITKDNIERTFSIFA